MALDIPPAAGAVVMGTGIVSIGLELDGEQALSRALFAIAAIVWLALAAALLSALVARRPAVLAHARTPAALTAVAATDVLGGRTSMLGWQHEADVLLVLGVASWALLAPYVLRHWSAPAAGASFLLVVATESIAVLASRLAVTQRDAWLGVGGIAFLVLGLVFYAGVLSQFELRQLRIGRGDHWVAGGALAIAALACARSTQAADAVPALHGAAGVLDAATAALWVAAIVWLPVLVGAELASRRLAYDLHRWSTVFPLGMYAVCSFADGRVRHLDALRVYARGWIWVAFAVWLVVAAASVRSAAARARAGPRP